MSGLSKNKEKSALVQTVLALDYHFSELERLGAQITSIEMKSDFAYDQTQRLLDRFAETGLGVSAEVAKLSDLLQQARVRAETISRDVAVRAEALRERKGVQQEKMEQFRVLGEKVKALSADLSQLKPHDQTTLSHEERSTLAHNLGAFESRLTPLIEEAQNLRQEAQELKLKFLAQNADSLTQTLQAVRRKLATFETSF